jgi:hypothetical protein
MRQLIFVLVLFIAFSSCESKKAESNAVSTVKVEVVGDTTIFYGSAVIVNYAYIKESKKTNDLQTFKKELQVILDQVQSYLKDPGVACKLVETSVVKVKNQEGTEFSKTFINQAPYKCLVVHASGAVLPISDMQDFNSIKQALQQGASYTKSIDESTPAGREEAKREQERALGNPVSDPNEKIQELPKNQILQRGEQVKEEKK